MPPTLRKVVYLSLLYYVTSHDTSVLMRGRMKSFLKLKNLLCKVGGTQDIKGNLRAISLTEVLKPGEEDNLSTMAPDSALLFTSICLFVIHTMLLRHISDGYYCVEQYVYGLCVKDYISPNIRPSLLL